MAIATWFDVPADVSRTVNVSQWTCAFGLRRCASPNLLLRELAGSHLTEPHGNTHAHCYVAFILPGCGEEKGKGCLHIHCYRSEQTAALFAVCVILLCWFLLSIVAGMAPAPHPRASPWISRRRAFISCFYALEDLGLFRICGFLKLVFSLTA